ncbi:GAF domain-containing protein [Natronomonas halophila]|uniref:GAF domain-containing protein n=1 Tax=Natronomonas halophila TaxID=2747817 RepID=UPI0015B63D37|nr:GAF domain-containing protein [Natronomonas halophila]QLD85526.1 GAF domain-containing protein [Natronomonas halophila]
MKILCADPSPGDRTAVREALGDAGYTVREAESLAEASDTLDSWGPVDCLVTEHELPDGTGLELVEHARNTSPDAACALYTDASFAEIDTEAFGDVVVEYLPKEAGPDGVVDFVEFSAVSRTQTAYPLPDDEQARIEALEPYAKNPGAFSDSVDRLTEIATELFDLEAAAVGLVDAHEEQFVACRGRSFGRIDREETICTYALLDHDVTVIEDVQADPRFEGNEGLIEADIGFYASAPLVTSEGHAIGTFCLYDSEPRSFSERNRELLSTLADEAIAGMELQQQARGETA